MILNPPLVPSRKNMPARFLVIEDDDEWAAMIRLWLKQAGWSDVEHCVSLDSGWRSLRSGKFDLVVLDLQLGNSNGFDLCERIRKNPDTRKLPIVVLTDDRHRRNAGLLRGADQFVAKTPNGAEFLAAVQSILRRRDLNEGVSRFTGLSLIPESREVRYGDENPVKLPPKLFRLLWLLAEIMPGPISKEKLARGLSTHSGSVIRVAGLSLLVKRLRDSLPKSLADRIVAIQGFGYLIIDPNS